MKKRFFIILGVIILLFGLGYISYLYWPKEDIVVDPNISEEYKQTLKDELVSYQDELAQNPGNSDLFIKIGKLEHKLGQLSSAERNLKQAIKIENPENLYLAYFYLGELYEDMGKYDEADDMLRISTQINPNTDVGFLALIDLYKKHYPGKADELDNIYRAASDFTKSPEVWASYARFLEDRREYRDAWIYWGEVLNAEPDNAQAKEAVVRLKEILGIAN
ncbi:MAG: hypothetical protein COW93_02345 [Parcubacteria group bacterium CG22_combo_CG10-13_8_21_14_all_41_9]|nr:MAG: hypothetical protein COW93_02345 [Parcubacteria group bacterium CG22_combo_CG10-13_8_21_14_all_41_9]